jgi:hypothetical protein
MVPGAERYRFRWYQMLRDTVQVPIVPDAERYRYRWYQISDEEVVSCNTNAEKQMTLRP